MVSKTYGGFGRILESGNMVACVRVTHTVINPRKTLGLGCRVQGLQDSRVSLFVVPLEESAGGWVGVQPFPKVGQNGDIPLLAYLRLFRADVDYLRAET